MLQRCVRHSIVCNVCIVAKRCILPKAKVTIDSLLEVVSIGININDLDLCLEVV